MINSFEPPRSGHSPQQKLFIGLLPASITKEKLFDYFSGYGSVLEIWFAKNLEGFCKGHGYVTMSTPQGALRILEHAPTQHVVNGRTIFVKPFLSGAHLKLQRINISRKRVYITNIPFSVTNFEIKIAFKVFGSVESAYRITSMSGEKRRFGYV